MKKLTVDLNYIDFETMELAGQNKNYPHSGLWMVKIKEGNVDLRFIDKSTTANWCIAPESICNGVFDYKELITTEPIETKKQYDGDFILEFSRILLNRK